MFYSLLTFYRFYLHLLLLFRYPGFYFRSGCTVGCVLVRGAAQIFCMFRHPFISRPRRVLIGSQVCFVMKPSEPFGWYLTTVVIQPFKMFNLQSVRQRKYTLTIVGGVLYPSVSAVKVIGILVILVPILVYTFQNSRFQFVLSIININNYEKDLKVRLYNKHMHILPK